MLTLLNLLSAIALLIWGTHIVRTGILRVYGSQLRRVLGHNVNQRSMAFVAGILVTALVQSSNATALLVTSFVSQGLMALIPALAIMLGADVGTALMARVLTLDLSWLSPLLIFIGVVFFLSRKQTRVGQLGRVAIGLGLMILALQLIVSAATPITEANGIKVLFASLTGDLLLDAVIGALFALISYSSLAAVLLTATLTASGVIALPVAIGLVIGANIGSGVLALLNTSMQSQAGRRVALGGLLYKLLGLLLVMPLLEPLSHWLDSLHWQSAELVIAFHLIYNSLRCLLMLPTLGLMAHLCNWLLPDRPDLNAVASPRHLDPSSLTTPTLALSNAVRETLRIGDIVDSMLSYLLEALNASQRVQGKDLRRQDDDIDAIYNALKLYLAQIQHEELSEQDSQRWAEIIEFSANLERAGEMLEQMLGKIQDEKTGQRHGFSENGLSELRELLEHLQSNLSLGLSVFFSADTDAARKLLRSKRRFRLLERRMTHAHVERLRNNIARSLQTSALHLELIDDMKRLNSMFCSSAYAPLGKQETGALASDVTGL